MAESGSVVRANHLGDREELERNFSDEKSK